MNKLAIQFRKFIGHKDFNLFREELFRFLATKALTEETEETYPFNAEMINQWNKFRKQEMVEKISLSDLAYSFYFGWPPPLDEQHVPFYRDEVKAGDMQIIADLFRVSNRI